MPTPFLFRSHERKSEKVREASEIGTLRSNLHVLDIMKTHNFSC